MTGARDVVSAFWQYHRLCLGNRQERLAADDWYWAWNEVESFIATKPVDAVDLLVELSEAAESEAEAEYLGAGPVDSFIVEHQAWLSSPEGRTAVEQLNDAVRRSPSLKRALESVWYDSDEIPRDLRDRIHGLPPPRFD